MVLNEAEDTFEKGLTALSHGHTHLALTCFERSAALERTPALCSHLAFCLAEVRKDYARAIMLANEAVFKEPGNQFHYLILGRVYVMAGEKQEAIAVFGHGLRYGRNKEINRELDGLGTRRIPVIPSLGRRHPLNKYLGKIFTRLGMR